MLDVEKIGAGEAALRRIVRERLIHPGSFRTKGAIGEGFQVANAEIRTAKRSDDAGVGQSLPIADGKSLVDADSQLASALRLLELAKIVRLAAVFRAVGHVLHAGYAVSCCFAHGCFHGLGLLFGRQRRHDALDESNGSVFENAGRIAVLVALDFAARHVLRVSVDAGELHGLHIHEGHVSVEPPQECRMIVGDIVN
jgi:hypothetical protein